MLAPASMVCQGAFNILVEISVLPICNALGFPCQVGRLPVELLRCWWRTLQTTSRGCRPPSIPRSCPHRTESDLRRGSVAWLTFSPTTARRSSYSPLSFYDSSKFFPIYMNAYFFGESAYLCRYISFHYTHFEFSFLSSHETFMAYLFHLEDWVPFKWICHETT